MKKPIILFCIGLISLNISVAKSDNDRVSTWMAELGGSILFPVDENYQGTYGKTVISPGIQISYGLLSQFYSKI